MHLIVGALSLLSIAGGMALGLLWFEPATRARRPVIGPLAVVLLAASIPLFVFALTLSPQP